MRIGRTDFEQIIRIFQKRHVPLALALWLELNYRAKWEDAPTLKRGELFCGRGELGAAIGASEQTIRTMLNQLQTNKLLTSKSTNKGTVFSIVSYGGYTNEEIETNKQSNQHINSEVTTNEEVRSKIQEKEVPLPSSSSPPPVTLMVDDSLDAHSQIQRLWPALTDDPYDLPWILTACNRHTALKVRQAFVTCYERGVHQRDLAGPLKGYITAICQNKDPGRQRLNGRTPPPARDHKQEMRDYMARKDAEAAAAQKKESAR